MPNYKITYSNELYHFGIKGMKWGVRRFRNEDGTLTSAGKKRYNTDKRSDDRKRFDEIRKKDIKSMTNKELADANYRMTLEQNYKNSVRNGKGKVNTYLRQFSNQAISAIGGALTTKATSWLLKGGAAVLLTVIVADKHGGWMFK